MSKEEKAKTFTTIVESPQGSNLKYDYDKELHLFRLSKMLPAGMAFPYDFGFIANTLGEDGDPLDVIIISEFKSFTGCVMDCRIVGAITAIQQERNGMKIRNDRFLAIPDISVTYASITNVTQFQKDIVIQLEAFFVNYNKEVGKQFKPLEIINKTKAVELILEKTVH